MSRKRVKFTQYSLDRFLNIAEYNDSLFDSDIKNLEVRKRKTPTPHLSFITQMKVKGESTPKSFKLGSYPEHDINEIRFRFNEYKKLCLDGIILVMSSNGKSKKNKGLKALLNKEI